MGKKYGKLYWESLSEDSKENILETWNPKLKYLKTTDEYVFKTDMLIKIARQDFEYIMTFSVPEFEPPDIDKERWKRIDYSLDELKRLEWESNLRGSVDEFEWEMLSLIVFVWNVSETVLKGARKANHTRKLGRVKTSWIELKEKKAEGRGRPCNSDLFDSMCKDGELNLEAANWSALYRYPWLSFMSAETWDFNYEVCRKKCIKNDEYQMFMDLMKMRSEIFRYKFDRSLTDLEFKLLLYKYRVEHKNRARDTEYEKKLSTKISKKISKMPDKVSSILFPNLCKIEFNFCFTF